MVADKENEKNSFLLRFAGNKKDGDFFLSLISHVLSITTTATSVFRLLMIKVFAVVAVVVFAVVVATTTSSSSFFSISPPLPPASSVQHLNISIIVVCCCSCRTVAVHW